MHDDRRFRRIVVVSISSVLAILFSGYILWALRPLILPITLGILLAYLCRPLKTTFKYPWLPDGIRVALLLSVLTGAILVAINFVQSSIPNEKENLEILVRLKYKFNEKFDKFMNIDPKTGKGNAVYNLIALDVEPLRNSLNNYLNLSPEQQESFLRFRKGVAGYPPVPDTYYQYFLENNKNSAILAEHKKNEELGVVTTSNSSVADKSFLITAVDAISIWLLMPFVFVFFLIDLPLIEQFFISLVPNRYFELALTVQEKVDDAIGKYLRGISMECGLVGIFMVIGLFLVGIPLKTALLIGILSGVATAIPFLGPIVGLVLSLVYVLIADEIHPLLPLVNMENSPIAVVIVNVVVLALDNLVFQPIVLGGAVSLHPLVIIIGLMAGSMMFGAAGVLLAIPAIVVIKVVIQHTFRGLKDYRII